MADERGCKGRAADERGDKGRWPMRGVARVVAADERGCKGKSVR